LAAKFGLVRLRHHLKASAKKVARVAEEQGQGPAHPEVRRHAFAYRRLMAAALDASPEALGPVPRKGVTKEYERAAITRVRHASQEAARARRQADELADAYRRLRAAALGVAPETIGRTSAAKFSKELEQKAIAQVRRVPKDLERRVGDLAEAYRRLRAAAEGVAPDSIDVTARPLKEAELAQVREKLHAKTLDGQLALGLPFEDAVIAVVRDHLGRGDHVRARSIAQSLQRNVPTRMVGELAEALVAVRLNMYAFAISRFADVPWELTVRLAEREYCASAARADHEGLDRLARFVIEAEELDAGAGIWILKYLVALRNPRCGALRDRLSAADLSESDAAALAWLDGWIDRIVDPTPPAVVPAGAVSFGVLGYKTPDPARTSANLGDFVQTVAASSHLLRRGNLTFAGDPQLASAFTDLASRVREDARRDGAQRTVSLVEMDRDASHLNPIPENTWALAFGWYAHSPYDLLPDFPFHPNVNPIFVSFHVNRAEILTPQAIDYLRDHAPIGCRDWNTAFLLLSAGVPAFFSGCITTTIGALYEDVAIDPSKDVVYVDTTPPEDQPDALRITQAYEEVRVLPLAENIDDALNLIGSYRTDYSRVVTSRLHCYLPAWSAGANVEFRPHRRSDVRFNGLLDADEDDLRGMRDRITNLLRPTLDAVIDGRPRQDVYDLWREITADEVALAQERFATVHPLPPLPFDVAVQAAAVTAASSHRPAPAGSHRVGEQVHVAIALDGNLKEQAKATVAGIVDNTTRPVHLHVLCRGHDEGDKRTVELLFPELAITWLPCDDLDYGTISGMLAHITVSTMDRLMLPYLLPDVSKVIYHDIDALTVADIGTLYDTYLGDSPLAGRDAPNWKVRLGVREARAHARKIPDPDLANDYLLRLSQIAQFDFVSFNAGIMVLNLDRMRDDDFATEFLPWVSAYGLNDQQLLNIYANRQRVPLPDEWNAFPAREELRDPRLIHWAGRAKPWTSDYITGKEHWTAAEQRVAARADIAGLAVAGAAEPASALD
jgi:lipopolysaccharide biosynthesis glycosyltransferase